MTIKKLMALYEKEESMTRERNSTVQVGNKPWAERPIQIATYKGYKIHAAPHQLADTGEWTLNIGIFHDGGGQIRLRQFSAANFFKTRDEAVVHSFNFGKQIIDT
jgi:hypothetical protein